MIHIPNRQARQVVEILATRLMVCEDVINDPDSDSEQRTEYRIKWSETFHIYCDIRSQLDGKQIKPPQEASQEVTEEIPF